MSQTSRASFRELFGWAMFDFANSSYTTVIITVVFSILFPRIIVGDAPDFRMGNLLWSIALSISYLVVLASSPLLGAIMDFTGAKKKFLFASYLLTVLSTASLYFVKPGYIVLGMILLIISNIGFSYGEAFIASFLPGLGPAKDLGKISGYAWGLGYFGGLASTAIVIFWLDAGVYTLENFNNLRLVGPVTGLFFLLAAIPTFLWVKNRSTPHSLPHGESLFSIGFKRLRKTFAEIRDFRDLVILLVSFFFAYAGLSIVISFTFIYGDQIVEWSAMTQTLMFVITQITAACGAFLFGYIQDRWGAKRTFIITLMLWFVTIILIYGVIEITHFINALSGISITTEQLFLVTGSIAGLGLGSTQSACRAMVGMFSPGTKAGEFFGLWSFSNRLAGIMGLLILGILQNLFGLRNAILVCSIFFMAAVIIALFVNEVRGREMALKHAGE
ncbi:MAG: MFS transporter [Deltaproteobacteria bacterium]|nr:MFS transporter [Deltaproteobacteria bacterium]TLN01329.1 MAG: MFS transporter [bacterium]